MVLGRSSRREELGFIIIVLSHQGNTSLSGITQALEGAKEVSTLAILTYSKSAILVLRKLDQGLALRLKHGFWKNSTREETRTPAWPGSKDTRA